MEGLLSLVRILRPSEKRLVHHYYSRTTNAEEKLRLKLFNLVLNGKVATDQEARDKLNTGSSLSAYSHLKSRLKEDVLNVLLMQDTNKRFVQPNRAAALDCRKKVAQAYLLLLRGAEKEGFKIFRKAKNSAKKYELLSEQLQLMHLKREKLIGRAAGAEIVKLNEDISKVLQAYQALLQVEEWSILISAPGYFKKAHKRGKRDRREAMVEDLGALFKKFRLARIGYWYYMASTEYHSAIQDYQMVVKDGKKFLKLVEKSPAVWSKNNLAGINLTLGLTYLELREQEDSVRYLSNSVSLFPVAGFNRLMALQYLAQAYLMSQNCQETYRIIDMSLSHPRIGARPQLKPTWLFFRACNEFLDGKVDRSFRTLNSDVFLLKERNEWNVQYRLLELYQMVEMGDEEWIEFKIDTLRKFLARNKKLNTPRVKAALEVLSNLWRKSFDHFELSEKALDLISKCLKEEKGYSWDPSGPELVRFDLWLKKKLDDSELSLP